MTFTGLLLFFSASVSFTASSVLFGLHGSADSSWGNLILPFEQNLVIVGKFNAVKLLSWENPQSVDWLKNHSVNDVVVRIMLQGDMRINASAAWLASQVCAIVF